MVELAVNHENGGGYQLKVRQMPLKRVLDSIADKTKIPLHYSELKEDLVNATCKAVSLKPLLECLLGNKADLIVRYANKQAKAGSIGPVEEAWILGSKANGTILKTVSPEAVEAPDKGLISKQNDAATMPDRTEELLAKAHSYNPQERAAAIGDLLAGGRKGDPDVRAALEQALTDQDPEVRVQAISSLSHREGNEALAAIQHTLSDSSDDVRLMAVDGIVDNVALLQQAVNDRDETIRSLAEIKLELLTQGQNDKP